MNIALIEYIEINTIGIAMLMILLFFTVNLNQTNHRDEYKYFIMMAVCNLIVLLADILIESMVGQLQKIMILVNEIICMIYYFGHPFFGYVWLRYSLEKLYPGYKPPRRIYWVFNVLFTAALILIIASPWTGWVFHVDEQNDYSRGGYMWLIMVITYIFCMASVVLTIRELRHPSCFREKAVYVSLLFFPIPTLVGNILQIRFMGLSLIWICSALSLLILFINFQNYQISRDPLTGLCNRGESNKQLGWEIRHLAYAEEKLYVVMVDVDHFKSINDQYGHVAGDLALKKVAKILQESYPEKGLVGRFGGDEFIIIGHAKSMEDVEHHLHRIREGLRLENQTKTAPYELSLSIGYSVYSQQDEMTMDDMIIAADAAMYHVKKQRGDGKR